MNARIIFYGWILTIFSAVHLASATPSEKMSVTASLPTFGSYYPNTFKNAHLIPNSISAKIDKYIQREFSTAVVHRITLRSGCVVDQASAMRAGRAPKFRYSLIYRIEIEHEILESYEFRLDVDDAGNIVNTENVPKDKFTGALQFMPMDSIIAVAKAKLGEWSEVKVKYLAKYDAVAWQFTKVTKNFRREEHHEVILINACDGKVIEEYKYNPIM